MKKHTLLFAATILLSFFVKATDDKKYFYSLNLNEVKDDKLEVTLITPKVSVKEITYQFPKIIPGSYVYNDYGRFISEFKAFDKNGNELKVKKLNVNSWKIKKAKKLHKITYWVEDTYDTDIKDKPAPMSGTNIVEDEVFVLNTPGFFGYLKGMKTMPIELKISHPEKFYGSTGLIAKNRTNTEDQFETDNYRELIDSPIMYNEPDTTILKAGGADVLVSVYSKGNKIKSEILAEKLHDLLEAQKEYLGGKLPVNKYAYLLFFGETNSGHMFGALEHSYSTLCTLPSRIPQEYANNLVRDIGSHEFFHIVTPLNIHSEQIHNFDYNNPEMSKHLWLYEGVTEYSANHVLIKYDLIDEKEFLERIRNKILQSKKKYNDALSFTEMSEGCFEKYKDQYQNVYEKGALIGMCLDIKLRKLSGGSYGIQNLLKELASKYGKTNPFTDNNLIEEITAMTYPEIGTFFKKHVEGNEPLPFKEIFEMVGIEYIKEKSNYEYTIGGIAVGFDRKTKKALVHSVDKIDEFGEKMGYLKGDIIHKINGVALSEDIKGLTKVLTELPDKMKEGEKLEMLVTRKDESGNEVEMVLSADIFKPKVTRTHLINFKENINSSQQKIKDAWLKP